MSEKEKMINGSLYNAGTKQLKSDRSRAFSLLRKFNSRLNRYDEESKDILEELFGRIGERKEIMPPFYCDYGYNIEIGEDFFCNFSCVMLDSAKIKIGDHCLIGPNVSIYTATHPVDPLLRAKDQEFAAPIEIGNNVWIGGNSVINPGVSIGDNSIIGSGSVVTKSVLKNQMVAGNPAKLIREI